jgi:hypothetical protein
MPSHVRTLCRTSVVWRADQWLCQVAEFMLHCRGLTRATYILCIEHPRPMRLSWESNPGPPALQAKTPCYVIDCYSEPWLVLLQLPPKLQCCKLLTGDRGWVWLGCGYIFMYLRAILCTFQISVDVYYVPMGGRGGGRGGLEKGRGLERGE